ncbi:MAG: hypothetical protein AAB902_00415 [Patescibacteria group bacterium]
MKKEIGAIKPNSLKSEHLVAGVKPIMACIGSYDDYEEIPIREQFSKQSN